MNAYIHIKQFDDQIEVTEINIGSKKHNGFITNTWSDLINKVKKYPADKYLIVDVNCGDAGL